MPKRGSHPPDFPPSFSPGAFMLCSPAKDLVSSWVLLLPAGRPSSSPSAFPLTGASWRGAQTGQIFRLLLREPSSSASLQMTWCQELPPSWAPLPVEWPSSSPSAGQLTGAGLAGCPDGARPHQMLLCLLLWEPPASTHLQMSWCQELPPSWLLHSATASLAGESAVPPFRTAVSVHCWISCLWTSFSPGQVREFALW